MICTAGGPRVLQRVDSAKVRDRELEMAGIAAAVADAYDVPARELYRRKRTPHCVLARHVAMFLLREAGYSTTEIAAHLKRDHSTVMYAWYVIDRRVRANEGLHGVVSLIAKRAGLL